MRLPQSTLRLTFQDLTGDSRCPIDAICVWAGSAPVVLRLHSASVDTVLVLDPPQGTDAAVVIPFRIELRELVPPARADQRIPREAYRAVLRVSAIP